MHDYFNIKWTNFTGTRLGWADDGGVEASI